MDLRTFQRRFAERVRTLRLARGLRQEDLEEYGIAWKSVQKIEYGITDPKISSLLKLGPALGVTLSELVRLDDHPPRRPHAETLQDKPKRSYGERAPRKKK